MQFGTNHYTLINIFQNAQITILIESIYNISFFKYLHFTHISVKCFTFEKFKLHLLNISLFDYMQFGTICYKLHFLIEQIT